MSNLFFYEYEVIASGEKVTRSGLVYGEVKDASTTKFLITDIKANVQEQGYFYETVEAGRLLSIKRV